MAKAIATESPHLNYDSDADVLYISFGQPEAADDSDVTDDDIIVRTRDGRIVGLTILNASARLQKSA